MKSADPEVNGPHATPRRSRERLRDGRCKGLRHGRPPGLRNKPLAAASRAPRVLLIAHCAKRRGSPRRSGEWTRMSVAPPGIARVAPGVSVDMSGSRGRVRAAEHRVLEW